MYNGKTYIYVWLVASSKELYQAICYVVCEQALWGAALAVGWEKEAPGELAHRLFTI